MPSYHFGTFADDRMKKTLLRIESEAKAMNIFDTIHICGNESLGDDFWENHYAFHLRNPQGFGCYIWKPYITLKILDTMSEGDFLLYADAGCQLNVEGVPRLKDYFEYAKENPLGVVGIQTDHTTLEHTKMDTLVALEWDLDFNPKQVMGGIFVLRKSPESVAFIKEWQGFCENHHLIDDSPSIKPDLPIFDCHRHDQSIFSLLCYKRGAKMIERDETWFPEAWDQNKQFPVFAKRLRYIT